MARNARELELMVAYGMAPLDALRGATSVRARYISRAGSGALPKTFAVIGSTSRVRLVMKGGVVVRHTRESGRIRLKPDPTQTVRARVARCASGRLPRVRS